MSHVIFEEAGELRIGTIRSQTEASAQVELPGGRRVKVKAAHLLYHINGADPETLWTEAQALAATIDVQLLWEVAPDGMELGFSDLARDYFGAQATPTQVTATLLALHRAPIHFQKRGKGRYRRQAEETLKLALAAVERKKREQAQIEAWVAELEQGKAPPEIAQNWAQLLYAPDKNALPWKALSAAADRKRTAPARLLAETGAIPSSYALHYERFRVNTFPHGIEFPPEVAEKRPEVAPELPLANVRAFSIDDVTTTEIDDAFSLVEHGQGELTVGIHIACPALGIAPGSPLDTVARERLSTVYMPGHKITMLPEPVIAAFSLDEGKSPPALSLYVRLNADFEVIGSQTRVERVPIAANLRLTELDAFDWSASEPTATDDARARGFGRALLTLSRAARALAARRGEETINRVDYSFAIEGNPASPEARVRIWPRPRGSPLDTLVAEFMILANSTWGRALAQAQWPAMYRVQSAGKTRMSSKPAPHEGLKLEVYLWATSPLRRYSDLINQRQILALVRGEKPAYTPGDATLLAAVADFDATYSAYAEFQQQMEHYWCLRWLEQEKRERVVATVIRENLVRFDHLPIVMRVADLPEQPAGTKVILAVVEIDLWEPHLSVRFVEAVPADPAGT
ncbi:MAG: RNB domain-containing ribonuclease [Casimicrobiaceae bacterium]|nr:RNB domain-containing ribonuclease [Casimicrobiaceae bacterium]MDW8312042.1 RNB domain-containing ribonuclease [Burkholderiales bacterium]